MSRCIVQIINIRMASSRFRSWFFVAYPESMPANWQDVLVGTHVPVIVSPLHDQDLADDESVKKPHYHILVLYSAPKTLEQFKDDFLKPLNTEVYQIAKDTGGCARYMCHLDQPNKHRYSIGDITCLNGADWEKIAFSGNLEYDMLSDIMDWVRQNEVYYYWDLVNYCLKLNRTWANFVVNRSLFWVTALKSLKDKVDKNNTNLVDILVYHDAKGEM